jgi:hypothetical protein
MNWDFTGAQVVKGEVAYSLEEFREDLYAEVRENFSDFDNQELDGIYQLAYDVCYCTATQRTLGELLAHCKQVGIKADLKYLMLIRDSNLNNIDMLKAIFARKVSEFMDAGASGEEALKKLDEYHRQILAAGDDNA